MKKINSLIHWIYAGSFLVAVFSIIGYLVWNANQMASQKKAEEDRRIIQERTHKENTLHCILEAQREYSVSWAAACKKQAANVRATLAYCINRGHAITNSLKDIYSDDQIKNYNKFVTSTCASSYGNPNSKPDCTLPSSLANPLNDTLKRNENLCREILS